jgi:hypothetical protein
MPMSTSMARRSGSFDALRFVDGVVGAVKCEVARHGELRFDAKLRR